MVPPAATRAMGQRDLFELESLCAAHNNLQAELVSEEQKRQDLLTDASECKISVSEVLQRLSTLRYHVNKSIAIALSKLPSSEPATSVTDLPQRLTQSRSCHNFVQNDALF